MENNLKRSLRKKRRFWSRSEEKILINIWRQYLPALKSQRFNAKIYDEMKETLKEQNVIADVSEVQFKIHNMTKKYRL